MNDLLFNVDKVPVTILGIDGSVLVPSGSNHAIVRKEGSQITEIISFCSEDYGLTRNSEIKQVMDEVLESHGFGSDFKYLTQGSNKFQMTWVINNLKESISSKDMLSPSLKVYNSYDRRLKFSFSTGIERLVCSNGMTILSEVAKKKMLHTTAIEGFASAVECIPLLNEFLENFEAITEPFFDLQSMKVPNIEARLDEVIDASSYPRSFRETALERIYWEMKTHGFTATDWLIYSGLNYAIVHEPSMLGKKFEEADSRVLSYLYS